MTNLSAYTIFENQSIKTALAKLDEFSLKINLTLFVVNLQNKMVGTLTDGDIRRGLLAGKTINDSVAEVMKSNFSYLVHKQYDLLAINNYRKKGIQLVPILDDEGVLVKVLSFRDKVTLLPMDAVIMAGGVGDRLRPLTLNTPKPLLPVGDRPIIEHNIDRLVRYGVENINISIRYLGHQIEEYLGDGSKKDARINYVKESTPLGTLGSIKLVHHFEHDTILVMNSDLLTNIDYEEMYKQFIDDSADFTVATVPYNVNVPFAIFETSKNEILGLKEKPTYTYHANAGIYILKRNLLDDIMQNEKIDTPDFIERLISSNRKVTFYPVIEYWLDIGRHEDYTKAQEDIKHLNLHN